MMNTKIIKITATALVLVSAPIVGYNIAGIYKNNANDTSSQASIDPIPDAQKTTQLIYNTLTRKADDTLREAFSLQSYAGGFVDQQDLDALSAESDKLQQLFINGTSATEINEQSGIVRDKITKVSSVLFTTGGCPGCIFCSSYAATQQ